MKTLRVLVVALIAVGCATNPATGRRQLILMSEAEEIQIGRQGDAEVRQQMGLYKDQALQRYVNDVGQRLARTSQRPNLPWSFAVVDEQAVNAFALPGGFIYITRGILPFLRNEAELAAVMGHEVGHVDAKHAAEAYSKQQFAGGGLAVAGILFPETQGIQGLAGLGLGMLFLKNGREAELESDQLGVKYATRNGWSPEGMPGLLNTLARLDEANGSSRGVPNWAMTHPPAADRVERVHDAVAAAEGANANAKATNAGEFERHLDGIIFGDSREKGMVRGNEFLHPVLRFALSFPPGWEIVNTDAQVSARESGTSNVAMLLELASGNGSPEQLARSAFSQSGLQLVDGARTRINGLDAFVGTYDGAIQNTRVGLCAAFVRSGQQTYVIAGLAPAAQFNGAARAFETSIGTFRALSAEEADRIRENRVDFYTARAGDTWDSIARGPAGGRVKAATLAIMNGSSPTAPPRAGDRLRIVVAG